MGEPSAHYRGGQTNALETISLVGKSRAMKTHGRKQVLLVEDDRELRETLREALEGRGWNVVAVNSGEEALTSWAGIGPDAVVTDYRTADIDGLALARVLRSKVRIPIVIFATELNLDLERQAEAHEVITVRTDDLVSLMAALDHEVSSGSPGDQDQ